VHVLHSSLHIPGTISRARLLWTNERKRYKKKADPKAFTGGRFSHPPPGE
jgi:hypothetical protein